MDSHNRDRSIQSFVGTRKSPKGLLFGLCRTTPEGANDADDVVFHVGQEPQMRISARKEVLSRRNDVFHAMFYGPYAESQRRLRHRAPVSSTANAADVLSTARVDHIYEPDVEGRAFKNLLRYVQLHLTGLFIDPYSLISSCIPLYYLLHQYSHGNYLK